MEFYACRCGCVLQLLLCGTVESAVFQKRLEIDLVITFMVFQNDQVIWQAQLRHIEHIQKSLHSIQAGLIRVKTGTSHL